MGEISRGPKWMISLLPGNSGVADKHPDVAPGMGVQFTELPPAAGEAIARFVREREPMFYAD